MTWAARAVENVPPSSMLEGGAGDSDTTTGKLVVPNLRIRRRCSRFLPASGAVEGRPEHGHGEAVAVRTPDRSIGVPVAEGEDDLGVRVRGDDQPDAVAAPLSGPASQ